MKWDFSLEGGFVGMAAFGMWVGLDGLYPFLSQRDNAFDPPRTFGDSSLLACLVIAIRLTATSLVVPLIEEVFKSVCHPARI